MPIELEEYNKLLKSEGLELWDFGDSVTVMPVPDFTSAENTYLISSVIYVMRRLPNNQTKILGVEIPHVWKAGEPILVSDELVTKIRAKFEEQAVLVSEGGPLPITNRLK